MKVLLDFHLFYVNNTTKHSYNLLLKINIKNIKNYQVARLFIQGLTLALMNVSQ